MEFELDDLAAIGAFETYTVANGSSCRMFSEKNVAVEPDPDLSDIVSIIDDSGFPKQYVGKGGWIVFAGKDPVPFLNPFDLAGKARRGKWTSGSLLRQPNLQLITVTHYDEYDAAQPGETGYYDFKDGSPKDPADNTKLKNLEFGRSWPSPAFWQNKCGFFNIDYPRGVIYAGLCRKLAAEERANLRAMSQNLCSVERLTAQGVYARIVCHELVHELSYFYTSDIDTEIDREHEPGNCLMNPIIIPKILVPIGCDLVNEMIRDWWQSYCFGYEHVGKSGCTFGDMQDAVSSNP